MALVLPEGMGGPVDRLGGLVVIAPARRAGDPGSNPGPGEFFSLKLLIKMVSLFNKNNQSELHEIKFLNLLRSLDVPERYEKCLRVSSSVKGKPLPAPPSGKECATS